MIARLRASQAAFWLTRGQACSLPFRLTPQASGCGICRSSRCQPFSLSTARSLAKANLQPNTPISPKAKARVSSDSPPVMPALTQAKLVSPTALIQELARRESRTVLYKAPSHRGLYTSAYITSMFMLGSGIGVYWFGNWGLPEGFESKLEAAACSLVGGIFLFFSFYFGASSFYLIKEITAIPIKNGARRTLQLQVRTRALPFPFSKARPRTYAVQDVSLRQPVMPIATALQEFRGLKDKSKMTLLQRLQVRLILNPIYQTRTVLFREGFVNMSDEKGSTIGKIDARGSFLGDGLILDRLIGPAP